MIPLMNNWHTDTRHAIKTTDCNRTRVGEGGSREGNASMICYDNTDGVLCTFALFLLCLRDSGRPFFSTSRCSVLKTWSLREKSRGLLWEEMKEEWGWLSHIWKPDMEQNSMHNIWNSNCIMWARHTAGHGNEGMGDGIFSFLGCVSFILI